MDHVISVVSVQDGWAIETETFANQMLFRSGERAEAAAKSLGQRYARAGKSAEIRIFLRDGKMAGRFFCPAVQSVGV